MTLDVGVIGVGSMGQHHARVYHELRDVRLVGVADAHPSTAESIARQYDTDAMTTDELLARVDAVSIAVPSQYHHAIGLQAIDAGVHTLVEKPIAPTIEEARELVDAAAEAGVTFQVGHIERFNPAVIAVSEFVEDLDIIAVEARRLGPPVDGGRDVGNNVVFDLMIHDIDVIQSLVGTEVTTVTATGSPDREYVNASVQFANDVVGTMTASRVSQRKVRELTITAKDCLVTVDYSDRAVWIDRRTRPSYLTNNGDLRYRSERVVERPMVDNGEPLKKEISAFIEAVQDGTTPLVTGEDGIRALALATRISNAVSRPEIPAQVSSQ